MPLKLTHCPFKRKVGPLFDFWTVVLTCNPALWKMTRRCHDEVSKSTGKHVSASPSHNDSWTGLDGLHKIIFMEVIFFLFFCIQHNEIPQDCELANDHLCWKNVFASTCTALCFCLPGISIVENLAVQCIKCHQESVSVSVCAILRACMLYF